MKQLRVFEGTTSATTAVTQTNCDESASDGMKHLCMFENTISA
jgi:hypothetical protein